VRNEILKAKYMMISSQRLDAQRVSMVTLSIYRQRENVRCTEWYFVWTSLPHLWRQG